MKLLVYAIACLSVEFREKKIDYRLRIIDLFRKKELRNVLLLLTVAFMTSISVANARFTKTFFKLEKNQRIN